MKNKKILSLLLVAVIVLLSAACGKIIVTIPVSGIPSLNNGTAAGTTAPVQQNTTSAVTPDSTAAQTESSTAGGTQSATEGSTAAPVTNAPADTSTPSGSSAPSTKAEIITYYTTAYNKIVTEGKTATKTYDYTSNYNNILEIAGNSTLKSIAGSLMQKYMVENTTAETAELKNVPPVGVGSLSISPDLISDATCTDKGTYYEVVLKSTGTDSKYEVDSVAGKGSAGVIGPLLKTEDVSGAAGSMIAFEGLHTYYATASVTAKIDKATGHITEFDFLTPSVLHFDSVTAAKIIKVSNCDIGLLFHQKWTVAY